MIPPVIVSVLPLNSCTYSLTNINLNRADDSVKHENVPLSPGFDERTLVTAELLM